MTNEEKLQNIDKQLKEVEIMYYKVLGAIEALEALDKGEKNKGKKREK